MNCAIRIREYFHLAQAVDVRRRLLGMTMMDLDERSGLQGGYSAKLICGDRHFGPLSLAMTLAALDCDLYLAPRNRVAPVVDHVGSAGQATDVRPKTGD